MMSKILNKYRDARDAVISESYQESNTADLYEDKMATGLRIIKYGLEGAVEFKEKEMR